MNHVYGSATNADYKSVKVNALKVSTSYPILCKTKVTEAIYPGTLVSTLTELDVT